MEAFQRAKHSYLPNLSMELIELIGKHILATVEIEEEEARDKKTYKDRSTYDGLWTLRMTCRQLNAKSQDLFAKAYFSERIFYMYNRWSLEALHCISEHVVFAKSLKHVRFHTARFEAEEDDEGIYAQRYIELDLEQKELMESDLVQQLLKITFLNFKKTANIPGLGLGDDLRHQAYNVHQICGYARLRRYLTDDPRRLSSGTWNLHAIRVLHTAVCETQYPVQDLCFGDNSTAVPPSYLDSPIEVWPYTHLKKLDISISDFVWLNKPPNAESQFTLAKCFATFLHHAPDIEHFSLTTDNAPNPVQESEVLFSTLLAVMEQLLDQGLTPLRTLRSFRLFGLYVALDSILRFLEITRSSVRELYLDHVLERGMAGKKVINEIIAAAEGRGLELLVRHSYDRYHKARGWSDEVYRFRSSVLKP